MKTKRNLIQICLLGAALLALPAVVHAQFIFTTNVDGTLNIYQYTGTCLASVENGLFRNLG